MKGIKQVALVFTIGLLLCAAIVPNEFKILGEKLKERRFESVLKIKLYNDKTKTKLLEEKQFEMKVWGKNTYYKFETIEAFANNRYTIVIYNDTKTILINRAIDKTKKVTLKMPLQELLDSAALSLYHINLVHKNGSVYTYRIYENEQLSDFENIIYTINVKELKPVSFEMLYRSNLNELLNKKNQTFDKNERPFMLGNFTTFNYLNAYKESDFDYSRILTMSKNGNHILKPEYKNYTVYNYAFQKTK